MKALGRGSLASYIKAALDVAGVLLWIAAIGLIAASAAYLTPLFLAGLRIIETPAIFTGRLAWQSAVPALASGVVIVAGGLVIVRRLKAVFASFIEAQPFHRENADHLRAIWVTLLVMELCRIGVTLATGTVMMVAGPPDGASMEARVRIDLTTWLAIGVLIVLAEVFREGARLREDQDLTI